MLQRHEGICQRPRLASGGARVCSPIWLAPNPSTLFYRWALDVESKTHEGVGHIFI